jgi:phage terminase large subunit-like protein
MIPTHNTKIFASAMPIWFAWAKKYKYMLLISFAQRKSIQTLRDIKRMVKDRKFQAFFGDWEGQTWSSTKIHLFSARWKVDMFIEAVGQGQTIFGSSEYVARPDIIVIDDIENLDVSKSNMRIEDLMNWFRTEVMPAASLKDEFGRTAKFILIGTPLDRDCFFTRITELGSDIEIITYPCLVDDQKVSKRLDIPIGESIWPERITKEEWIAERERYIRMGAYRAWMSQFMMKPVPASILHFGVPDMITAKEANTNLLAKRYRVVITADAAYTQKSYSDYTAVVVAGHTPGSSFDVLESFQGKIDQQEFYSLLDELKSKYQQHLDGIYVESLAFGSLQGFFQERNLRLGKKVDIEPIIRHGKFYVQEKHSRIAMVMPYQASGMIRFVEDENDLLLSYMKNWQGPGSKGTDDLLDALSFQLKFMEESSEIIPDIVKPHGNRKTDAALDIEMTLKEWDQERFYAQEELEYGQLGIF